MILAARLKPILNIRWSIPMEAFSFSRMNCPAWMKYSSLPLSPPWAGDAAALAICSATSGL